ncbi:hypothetical protein FGLOB1_4866 [Fusarium globosum]|uniref:Uncharacterized protein n=1 Tax=Fusarium globosum TaxID=78864 RepID=A0A8H5YFI6_9HYPO|nr:hypothetical protein FGLOB1_4866 [Fusarium globosum]
MEVSPLEQRPSNDFHDLLQGLRFFQNNPQALKDAPEDGLESYLRYTIIQLERWGPLDPPGDFSFHPKHPVAHIKHQIETAAQWVNHTPGHVHNVWKNIKQPLLDFVSELEDDEQVQEPTPVPEGPRRRTERDSPVGEQSDAATVLAASHPLWVAKTQEQRDDVRQQLKELGVLKPQETRSQLDDTDLANVWQNSGEDRIFKHHPDSASTSPEPASQRRRTDESPDPLSLAAELQHEYIESDEDLADE